MQVYNDELYHYGVKGMKWGKRTTYGRKPLMLTKGRQLSADKKTLDKLNTGNHHTSVGLTKKRQEAFDKRDKAVLEKRIEKNTNKKVDFYNKERNKDQDSNYLEKSKLRTQYDNGKISYDDYVKQHIELGRKQTQKSLDNAKKMALSNMSEKEQQRFKKKTDIGKKQADMLLEKIARGDKTSFMDKLSLHGFK